MMITMIIVGGILAFVSVGAIMAMLLVTLRSLDDITKDVEELKKGG